MTSYATSSRFGSDVITSSTSPSYTGPRNNRARTSSSSGAAGSSTASASGSAASPGASSAAAVSGGTGLNTTAGMLIASGAQNNVNIANRNPDNQTIQGLVTGSQIDANTTAQNTGLAIMYNDAFLGTLHRTNMAMADADVGRASTLMGIQGNIDKEFAAVEGDQQRRNYATQGEENRKSTLVTNQQERLNIGARGMMDRALSRTQGEQQRLGQDNEALNQVRLRNDAREQIARQGARFYG